MKCVIAVKYRNIITNKNVIVFSKTDIEDVKQFFSQNKDRPLDAVYLTNNRLHYCDAQWRLLLSSYYMTDDPYVPVYLYDDIKYKRWRMSKPDWSNHSNVGRFYDRIYLSGIPGYKVN